MELIVAIIIGLLLGWYCQKRKRPMTVKDWYFGLFIILIFVIITNGFMHIDDIMRGAEKGMKAPTVLEK